MDYRIGFDRLNQSVTEAFDLQGCQSELVPEFIEGRVENFRWCLKTRLNTKEDNINWLS